MATSKEEPRSVQSIVATSPFLFWIIACKLLSFFAILTSKNVRLAAVPKYVRYWEDWERKDEMLYPVPESLKGLAL